MVIDEIDGDILIAQTQERGKQVLRRLGHARPRQGFRRNVRDEGGDIAVSQKSIKPVLVVIEKVDFEVFAADEALVQCAAPEERDGCDRIEVRPRVAAPRAAVTHI